MTLLDAPAYSAAKTRKRQKMLLGLIAACLIAGGLVWYFWDWPQERLVNRFFVTLESGNMPKAFGVWNDDPDWQQHPEKYTGYNYGRFTLDWGASSDWGPIKTHKITLSKTVGSGVVIAVKVNGQSNPVYLWVQHGQKALGFAPPVPALGID